MTITTDEKQIQIEQIVRKLIRDAIENFGDALKYNIASVRNRSLYGNANTVDDYNAITSMQIFQHSVDLLKEMKFLLTEQQELRLEKAMHNWMQFYWEYVDRLEWLFTDNAKYVVKISEMLDYDISSTEITVEVMEGRYLEFNYDYCPKCAGEGAWRGEPDKTRIVQLGHRANNPVYCEYCGSVSTAEELMAHYRLMLAYKTEKSKLLEWTAEELFAHAIQYNKEWDMLPPVRNYQSRIAIPTHNAKTKVREFVDAILRAKYWQLFTRGEGNKYGEDIKEIQK